MLPKNAQSSELGKLAEDFASKFISSKGYVILDRNFKSRFGEIDIIALDGDTLVFVEVKARWSKKFGAPEEAVTPQKISKIIKTGEYYSILKPNLPKKLRIDVVALEIAGNNIVSSKLIKVY